MPDDKPTAVLIGSEAPVRLTTGRQHTLVLRTPPVYEHLPLLIPLRYARLWNVNVPWRPDLSPAEYDRGLQRSRPGGDPSTAGSRYMSRRSRNHNGIDIQAPVGTPLYAGFAGTVTRCVSASNYDGNGGGYRVYIQRRGRHQEEIWYFHLSDVADGVRLNASVSVGQVIGRTGVTGNAHPSNDPRAPGVRDGAGREPHLHLERRVGGAAVDPSIGLPMGNWEWE